MTTVFSDINSRGANVVSFDIALDARKVFEKLGWDTTPVDRAERGSQAFDDDVLARCFNWGNVYLYTGMSFTTKQTFGVRILTNTENFNKAAAFVSHFFVKRLKLLRAPLGKDKTASRLDIYMPNDHRGRYSKRFNTKIVDADTRQPVSQLDLIQKIGTFTEQQIHKHTEKFKLEVLMHDVTAETEVKAGTKVAKDVRATEAAAKKNGKVKPKVKAVAPKQEPVEDDTEEDTGVASELTRKPKATVAAKPAKKVGAKVKAHGKAVKAVEVASTETSKDKPAKVKAAKPEATTAVKGIKPKEYKRNLRCVIAFAEQGFYIGRVTSVKDDTVNFAFDDGDKVSLPKNSARIKGLAVNKSRKSAISAADLHKWLAKA